jgi:hypothetical protein
METEGRRLKFAGQKTPSAVQSFLQTGIFYGVSDGYAFMQHRRGIGAWARLSSGFGVFSKQISRKKA